MDQEQVIHITLDGPIDDGYKALKESCEKLGIDTSWYYEIMGISNH